MLRRSVAPAIAITSLFTASLAGQQPASEPLLDVRFAGLYEVTPHEKDRALHDAMRGVMARLGDLRAEMDLEADQASAIALGWSLLSGGLTLRIESFEKGPKAVLVSRPGAEDAPSVFRRLHSLLESSGMAVEQEAGDALLVESPAGPVRVTMDRLSVSVRVGEVGQVRTEIESDGLPGGAAPIASGRIDLGAIMAMVGPQIENAMQDMPPGVFAQWMSPEAPVIGFSMGVSDGRLHLTQRAYDAEDAMAASGVTPGVVFSADDFLRIPSDAVRLYAQPIDVDIYLALLDVLGAQAGEDPLAELDRLLGLDLREDLLAHVGSKLMIYQAESTGGGGLFSTVALIELTDAEAFAASHARMVESINRQGLDMARGYLRVRDWTVRGADDVTAYTLVTPGLPVPIEVSWAVVDNVLVKAVSRHGLEIAVQRVRTDRGRGGSILDNPDFSRAVVERLPRGGAATVSFVDAPRLARKGYGLASVAMTMLANAVRSPDAPDRVEGPLMPAYAQFIAGIEPSATIGWWDGEDFRSHAVMDASFVVGMAATLGSLADLQSLAIPMIGAGVMLPAVGQARMSARQIKSQTQVRGMAQAMIVFAAGNNNRAPESTQDLIDQGIITPELLESPFGPSPDGGPGIAVMVGPDRDFSPNAAEIVAIDRAMMFQGLGVTSVAFADGRAELLTYPELQRYLQMPENNGVREGLGIVRY